MAKDPSSTRIPRLDGVSRIPLPGSIRPPSSNFSGRPSQILRPPTAFAAPRATSASTAFTGLRPPTHSSIVAANVLKKSSSGDRINQAVNMVSKKTSNAFKKLFSKSATPSPQQLTPARRPPPPTAAANPSAVVELTPRPNAPDCGRGPADESISLSASTPRPPLARSETFVRDGDATELLGLTHDVISAAAVGQSTPAPASSATFATKDGSVCERTRLLSPGTRHALYTTHSLESGGGDLSPAPLDATLTAKDPQRTLTLESTRLSAAHGGFGHTIDLDSPQAFGETLTIGPVLGQTISLDSPKAVALLHVTHDVGSTTSVTTAPADATRTLLPPLLMKLGGSMDNLQLIDDISIPSDIDIDVTLKPPLSATTRDADRDADRTADVDVDATYQQEYPTENLEDTLPALLAPDRASMKLPLNSTMNTERLLDLTGAALSPPRLLSLTRDFDDSLLAAKNHNNNTQLLYMTPQQQQQQQMASTTTTPDRVGRNGDVGVGYQHTPMPASRMLAPLLLKGAQSEMLLPTRTPDDELLLLSEPMEVDATLTSVGARTEQFFTQQQQHPLQNGGAAVSLQELNGRQKTTRYSFGLDLTESTLDCSIELCDVSLSSTAASQPANGSQSHNNNSSLQQQHLSQQLLRKQNSFEMDESLGILTPDQMKEFLDSTATTNTNNNLELPLGVGHGGGAAGGGGGHHKMSFHQMRIDQTPSPEELPLDPVEVKTDISDMVEQQQQQQHAAFQQRQQQMQQQQHHLQLQQSSSLSTEPASVSCDADLSKSANGSGSDALMSKSNVSKISTSFITSVTSVTSLDTGYQGDGEMSRPASRGAGDHSPSNGPAQRKGGVGVSRQPSFNQQMQPQQQLPMRRQDPMTDSDFFTESDADDVFHRGDRRAQVIDGQLYGPMLQPAASVFITEDPQLEDSCMESSGIFTDVENRCDDDLALLRRQDTQDVDMSPDADSTETVKSSGHAPRHAPSTIVEDECDSHQLQQQQQHQQQRRHHHHQSQQQLQHLSDSQTSATMQSSFSTDRISAASTTTDAGASSTLSNRTSYCSVDGGSALTVDCKSFSSLDEAFAPCGGGSGINNIGVVGGELREREHERERESFGAGKTSAAGPIGCAPTTGASVKRTSSPRKHSSLSSLCTVNGAHAPTSTTSTSSSPTPNSGPKHAPTSATKKLSSSSSLIGGHKVSPVANSSGVTVAGSKPRSSPRSKKSPVPRTNVAAASLSPSPSSNGLRKTPPPNKWDAVMSKIASNKLLMKKNYSDVKSKVSTGVGAGSPPTPSVRRSPSSVSAHLALVANGRASPSPRSSVARVFSARNSSASSPVSATSPSAGHAHLPTDTGSSGLQSSQAKRLLQGSAAQRGRSYSKDSQKSSQSDISLSGGSPKLLVKTPLRAAKKRDVRNLTISPTDLGPPPKTQQTANGTSTRPKPLNVTLTQKCLPSTRVQSVSPTPSSTAASTAASTPTGGGGNSIARGSPPTKKLSILSARRLDAKAAPAKSPLKDHNRLIGTPTQQQQPSTPTGTKNGVDLLNGGGGGGDCSKPQTPIENHENVFHPHNNNSKGNNNNIGNNHVATKSPSTTTTRSNSQTSSPILSHGQHGRKAASNHKDPEKKTSSKLLAGTRKLLHNSNKSSPQAQHSLEAAVSAAALEPLISGLELEQLKHLNRHSCNGRLDYQSLEQHLQQTAEAQRQQHKGIEAMGVLLQYLVFDLDAFACPAIKSERTKAKENLCKTLQLLDEAKSACTELQDQLCDKEAYFVQREEELQALHRCELEKAQANLSEMQLLAKEQISALKAELCAKDADLKRSLDCYRLEMDNKLAQKQLRLQAAEEREKELLERVAGLEKTEQDLRDKVQTAEDNFAERLQAATQRERELSEKLRVLNKELDRLRENKESSERELKDKLNLSQDEIAVLRSSSTRRSINDSLDRSHSPRNSSSASAASMEITRLQSEAESLRCVLELKQKEISKLTKHNEELIRDADERAALQAKISLLESQNEMLQSELEIKSDKEKEFLRQIDEVQKAFNHENVKRTRLSYDNEALQWQLKQRSEQLHIVEAKLQELSSQELQTSQHSSLGSLNRNTLNGSAFQPEGVDVSPPASPIVKGVIEKTDSVSWVLEMDDDTPEAAASKMVKRAGSFRSVERSPSTRRQLSMSATATCAAAPSAAGSNSNGVGPNPLSQSMSATSVVRQHSNDAAEFLGRANSRIRSKSVSVKSPEPSTVAPSSRSCGSKKMMRQSSAGAARNPDQLAPNGGVWMEPMGASSPYGIRPRSSTLKAAEHNEEALFRRSSHHKLITCDTSALNSGERLEMRALPTHPSVHDLKALKKCQEIQESAGEAMVSGTNSEDEGCSASSDEVATSSAASTSSSTASATSGSSTSLNHIKNHHHMSLEEVLLLDKINNSLNGTPMEVSWSDEADAFAGNGSTV